MNQKTLIGLVIAAIAIIGAAVAINHAKKPLTENAERVSYLFPGLREDINDINKIVLTGADNKIIATMEHGKEAWTLTEKGGYPADNGKLREFLLKLANAEVVEQKTANKDKYTELGVEDISVKDAKGVLVELDGLPSALKLIIGNASSHGGGTFVRRADEAQSWLAKGTFTVDKTTTNWLKRDLADIPATRISDVTLTQPDNKTLHIYKEARGDANFKVSNLPKGRELSSDAAANGLSSTLAGLRIDDVVAAKDAEPANKVSKAHYAAFDGLVVDALAWEKEGKNYAQFKASLDPVRADKSITDSQAKDKLDYEARLAKAQKEAHDAKPTTGAPDEAAQSGTAQSNSDAEAAAKAATEVAKPLAVSDPAKERVEKLAALNKEIDELNKRFNGWTYVLPAHKFSNVNKSMDELLKPMEQKKTEEKSKSTIDKKPAIPPVKSKG